MWRELAGRLSTWLSIVGTWGRCCLLTFSNCNAQKWLCERHLPGRVPSCEQDVPGQSLRARVLRKQPNSPSINKPYRVPDALAALLGTWRCCCRLIVSTVTLRSASVRRLSSNAEPISHQVHGPSPVSPQRSTAQINGTTWAASRRHNSRAPGRIMLCKETNVAHCCHHQVNPQIALQMPHPGLLTTSVHVSWIGARSCLSHSHLAPLLLDFVLKSLGAGPHQHPLYHGHIQCLHRHT